MSAETRPAPALATGVAPAETASGETRRRLTRSRRRVIAGVCGGFAEYLGYPPAAVRVAWLLFTVIPVLPGLPAYLVAWIALPRPGPAPPEA